MHVEFIAFGMHPQSSASFGNRDLRGSIHYYESGGFNSLQQLSDVDVSMALGTRHFAVDRQTPFVAPQRFRLFDSGAPEQQALLRRHIGQGVLPFTVESRENQKPVRLSWIGVFQEEHGRVGGLSLGLPAEGAFTRFPSLRVSDVAGAAGH